MSNWIEYLRGNIYISFETCEQIDRRDDRFKMDKKVNRYELKKPIDVTHGVFSDPNANLWLLGSSFYSASMIIGRNSMSEFLANVRSRNEGIMFHDFFQDFPRRIRSWVEADIYMSTQYQRLSRVLWRNELMGERLSNTDLLHSIELCLKAITAHANHRETGYWIFEEGHKLDVLYGNLPDCLKSELGAELQKFAVEYTEYARRIREALENCMKSQRYSESRDVLNEIIDDLNSRGYTYLLNDGLDSLEGKIDGDWLCKALKDLSSGNVHRYGPFNAKDEYSNDMIVCAKVIGRFFYEHLFPPSLLKDFDNTCMILPVRTG